MDAEAQDSFREFVQNRSSALLQTAVLLSGGDRHAAEDLLQNALIKAAGRWHRIYEPEAYIRQILYRQQISRWRLKWRRRELSVAEPPETGADPDGAAAAWRWDPLGDRELKGRTAPVAAYRLVAGPQSSASFVARDAEVLP